jgi:hypothetical protein
VRLRRGRPSVDVEGEARDSDRDSGEDEYESEKEEAHEISPSGMTRVKTDGL